MKKKLLALIMACAMFAVLFVGCAEKSPDTSAVSDNSNNIDTEKSLDYPKLAITINGSNSGSTVDTNVRAFAQILAKYLPVNVIVNSTASQVDSYRDTINAEPDGYTMSITTANVTLCDVQNITDFDSIEDVTFVGNIAKGGGYWVAITKDFSENHNISTFNELVEYSKSHPQELNIATSYGTLNEIPVTSLIQDCGIDATEVSIGAAGERTIAFIAGELDIFVGTWGSISQYVESGDVICLCSYGDERSPFTPDIPCTGELGYQTVKCATYYTVTMPKETPAEIVAYMQNILEETVADQECIDTLAANSTEAYFMSGEETKQTMSALKASMLEMGLDQSK